MIYFATKKCIYPGGFYYRKIAVAIFLAGHLYGIFIMLSRKNILALKNRRSKIFIL